MQKKTIHYLKVTLDPGWSTPSFSSRLLGGVKNVPTYNTAQQPGFLGAPGALLGGGGHDGSSGPTAFVETYQLGISINLLNLQRCPACASSYITAPGAFLCCTGWNSLSFALKPFHQSPKPGVGSHGVRSLNRAALLMYSKLSAHGMDAQTDAP